MIRNVLFAALVLGLAVTGAGAQTAYTFVLDGSQEVPAVATSAIGVGFATLDASNNLTVTIQHNVTPAVTMAHIHQAPAGSNGPVVFGFTVALTSPFSETFSLSAAQVLDLNAGNYYVNLHTAANPGGEIRGQIVNAMQQQVFVNEFLADPTNTTTGGVDANNDGAVSGSDDEFIELVNGTDATVTLDGWTIEDGFGARHTFPAGTVLDSGAALVIFGGGDDSAFPNASQLASSGALGLNNGGDTITIRDAAMNIVDLVNYSASGDGTSTVRDTETTSGTFVDHNTLAAGLDASPGFYNDGVFLYPAANVVVLMPQYPGNGTDADMVFRLNGVVDEPITNVHSLAVGDLSSLEYRSFGGSLAQAPFLSLAQVLTTGSITAGIPLSGAPADINGPLILDLTPGVVTAVLFDGISNPGGLFNPVLNFTEVNFFVPPFLFGTGQSIIITCLPVDGSQPSGFGNVEAHELILN